MFGFSRCGHHGRRFARGDHPHSGVAGSHHEMPEGARGPGRGGMGRRGRRVFDHGDLRYVILRLIAEKPRYGYDIIKAIEEMVAGAYSPSPGVIYPTLTLLEELGYASLGLDEGGKKLYTITPEGTAYLDANRVTVDMIFARIEDTRSAQADGQAPQLVRAMENVKLALRLRLARGPLSDEQLRAVAAALDAAALGIEQA
ncbi:MAG: PadR family transcriptional regulator [Azospirillaceae bacterium]|nr:PadR family transcriptional regulator [Azospirillaceae bacterium]